MENSEIKNQTGLALNSYLDEKDLSVVEFAKLHGCTKTRIHAFIATGVAKLSSIEAICVTLGIHPMEFYERCYEYES